MNPDPNTVAAVVAWLRERACGESQSQMGLVGDRYAIGRWTAFAESADAIERGEPFKTGDGG